MDPIVVTAVLAAALLHAAWHALVKTSGDQVTALAGMNLVSAAVAALLLPFVTVPSAKAGAVIGLSALLHVGYKIALARLYSRADLSVAYPLARGLAPAMASAFAFAFMQERLGLIATSGMLAISLGAVGAVTGHAASRMSGSAFLAALIAGTTVAAYSVVDAYGVRIHGDWLGFTAWLVAADSLAFLAFALATRGRAATSSWRRNWRRTLISGLLGTASFGVFLWALGRAQVGPVAALRETSIVFAALIGMALLREHVSARRVASAALAMLGAGAIAMAR